MAIFIAILFDERDPEHFKRVTAAAWKFMRHCVSSAAR